MKGRDGLLSGWLRLRFLLFTLLAGVVFLLLRVCGVDGAGNRLDRLWLNTLVYGVRNKLIINDLDNDVPVVFVGLDDASRGVFSEWPLAPLDWALLLDKVVEGEPAMVVVDSLLRWKLGDELALNTLKQSMVRVPVLLLGVERGEVGGSWPAESVSRHVLGIGKFSGRPPGLTDRELVGGVTPPEDRIGAAGVKVLREKAARDGAGYPLLFWAKNEVFPTILMEALMGWWGCEPEEVDMVTGGWNSGFAFRSAYFVPTSNDGRLPLNPKVREAMPRVGAGIFLSDKEVKMVMDGGDTVTYREGFLKGKIVVLGDDTASARTILLPNGDLIAESERLALSIATAVSTPGLRTFGVWAAYIFWGILVVLMLIFVRNQLVLSVLHSFVMLVVFVLLAWAMFQIKLVWFSLIPFMVLWSAAMVTCVLVPRSPWQSKAVGELDR